MFTFEQIKEIAKKLQLFGIKDSQFKKVEDISGNEEIPVLQNNENKNLKISDFIEYIKNNIGDIVGPSEVTLTVSAYPADAIIKLDGVICNSIVVKKGTTVKVEVEAVGYIKYSSLVEVNSDKELIVALDKEVIKEKGTLTVTATPLDAEIRINGIKRNSITEDLGTSVHVVVAKEGYKSYVNNVVITQKEQILNVLLEEESIINNYTFTINPTPSDSIIKLNGSIRNSIVVESETTVTWEVSKEGYNTKTGNAVVTSNTTLEVELEKIIVPQEKVTFSINATPKDAVVKINGSIRSTITVDKGSSVTWEVSKEGYTTQNGTEIINTDIIKDITLVLIPSEWTEFTVEASSTTENPIEAVPYTGGLFSLQAYVTENKEIKDVTSFVEWTITGDGCTNIRDNIFEWTENSLTSTRKVTIEASVTDPLSNELKASVESIQEGKTTAETYLTVTPKNLAFKATGESRTLNITSNTSWSII